MLVLSRRKEEGVLIGQEIAVQVLEVRGDRVRLGFSAPGEVPINRKELTLTVPEIARLHGVEVPAA